MLFQGSNGVPPSIEGGPDTEYQSLDVEVGPKAGLRSTAWFVKSLQSSDITQKGSEFQSQLRSRENEKTRGSGSSRPRRRTSYPS